MISIRCLLMGTLIALSDPAIAAAQAANPSGNTSGSNLPADRGNAETRPAATAGSPPGNHTSEERVPDLCRDRPELPQCPKKN
jgi:hypothetical protein